MCDLQSELAIKYILPRLYYAVSNSPCHRTIHLDFSTWSPSRGSPTYWNHKLGTVQGSPLEHRSFVRSLRPSLTPAGTSTVSTAPTVVNSRSPSVEEWELRDNHLAGIIFQNVKDPHSIGIKLDMTSQEVWKKLTDKFKTKSEAAQTLALEHINQYRYITGTPFEEYFRELEVLRKSASNAVPAQTTAITSTLEFDCSNCPTVLTPATRLLPTSEKPKIPCPNASANQTVPEVIQLEGFQILPIAADLPPPAQPTPIPSPTKPDNPLFSDEPIDLDNMPAQPGSSSAPPPPMTTEQIIHALAEQVANLTAAVSGRAAAKSSMNKPDLFKGQSSTEARHFLAQFLAWASEQPDLKNNHGKTIKSALGFLTDKAADWATPYLNKYNNGRVPFAGLWPNFVAAFKLRFESVDPEMEARAAIETIHQGKGQSAAEYSQHFKDDASKAAYSRKSDATWS
ncbi:hypothetical protein D9757_002099 [Collybiopsis confluens]|uniref:Retrotransposon gag domain-containing protein n=1 Tax=Collybiopsis confluens TaxID=2823264 RepID=A0A8H5MG78_9AGAR|nr:hypothetical protein D9757_002099 [Collybiopsis confluens]